MSNLFDTLEQIRRNETVGTPGNGIPGNSHDRPAPGHRRILILTVLAVVMVLFYFWFHKTNPRRINPQIISSPTLSNPSATSDLEGKITPPPAGPSILQPPPSPPPPTMDGFDGKTPVAANNQAVEMIEEGNPWAGIYLLAKIIDRYPEQVEPMINLGLALAEQGLTIPAGRYLQMAKNLAPHHPAFIKNQVRLQEMINPEDMTRGKN
ncbi:MAG: hypothetical protein KJ950_12125 [Proteobacteria bacterium]|nr:hypothetical protein [Pseudomonadota bacterium]MBU1688079.1 hypothetical protein [Pseudomonadota bacterium]